MQNLLDDLESVEPSNLTQSKVYLYDGILYRYLYKSDSIKAPQYYFRPLPNQRKRSDLKVNASKIYNRIKEVRSLYGQTGASVENSKAVQLSLF